MWKKLMVGLLVFASLFGSGFGQASPVLKLDVANETSGLPASFRSTAAVLSLENSLADSGLTDLNMSGSAQFSAMQLGAVLEKIGQYPIVIVDLRQECHGFIDGAAVSWYGHNNWANQNKSMEQVQEEEAFLLAALQSAEVADVALQFKASGKSPNAPLTEIPVRLAYSEATLAANYGIGYLRIFATDHLAPGDEQIEAFLTFYRTLPANTWLHFHCHAGHGRTTTFMAMYDMLRNRGKVSLDDTITRQALLGGIDLAKVPNSKKGWEVKAYQDRLEFLRQFHTYVSTEDVQTVSWLQWKQKMHND